MKGLMIKDLMCMRRQLILFGYAVVSVLVLSVLYVLSCKYGNLALANVQMMRENGLTEVDIRNLSTWVLALFMLLPIAVTGDVATVFRMDGEAGFAKVSASLPLSVEKRVIARYLTVFSVFGIGVGIDVLLALVLSFLTDIIIFADIIGIILSAASVMSIYGALTIVFCFWLGNGKEDYASLLSCLLMVGTVCLVNFRKIRDIFMAGMDGQDAGAAGDRLNVLMDFLKYRFYLLCLLAALVLFLSYLGAVGIARRKRGII